MQQAVSAHSATEARASSGKSNQVSATRRGVLGALVVLPAITSLPPMAEVRAPMGRDVSAL